MTVADAETGHSEVGRQQRDFLVKRQQRDDIVDTLVIAQPKIMEGIISAGRSNRN